MVKLHLDVEKFILVSALSMTTLMAGQAMSSETCKAQSPLWNQQIQSSTNFASAISRNCQ